MNPILTSLEHTIPLYIPHKQLSFGKSSLIIIFWENES